MNNGDKKIIGYDANTGFPIYEEEDKKILRFNPQTGAPIYEKKEDNIVGYNPNTGEPIYKGEENLMESKKSKVMVGFDPKTGFPIYEENSSVNYEKVINIKMSFLEKILCIGIHIAAAIFAFYGFVVTWCGIVAGILLVSFVLIDIIIYKKQLQKNINSNNIYTDKISFNKSYKLLYILMVIAFFVIYVAMCSKYNELNADGNGWDDASGGGAGWYAILFFWPLYVVILCGLFASGMGFLSRRKREIRKNINL